MMLPSFVYLAGGPELPPGAARLPWNESPFLAAIQEARSTLHCTPDLASSFWTRATGGNVSVQERRKDGLSSEHLKEWVAVFLELSR